MSDESVPNATAVQERRRRGRRPASAAARRAAVEKALADLTAGGIPFSMQDVAERAGISRATLYRDAGLRDLVGDQGNGPAQRPVSRRDYDQLQQKLQQSSQEQRRLKTALRQAEDRARLAEEQVARLSDENFEYERAARRTVRENSKEETEKARKEAYAEGFAAGVRAAGSRGGGARSSVSDLNAVAARLPKASLLNARRTLVRALHPDLFAQDPAAALIATELLKQLNALAQKPG